MALRRLFQGTEEEAPERGPQGDQDTSGRWHLRFRWERCHWEKKACGLIVSDQEKKRDLRTHVVEAENLENATALLSRFKENSGVRPELVVCDFSPNLIGAIQQIFGKDVVQIDGFHVMRELNNGIGIKRDLLDFRERLFQAEIRELQALRKGVTSIQKALQKESNMMTRVLKAVGRLPAIQPTHSASGQCAEFVSALLELLQIEAPPLFFQELLQLLRSPGVAQDPKRAQFFQGVQQVMPKKRYTQKGMMRTKRAMLQRLKTYFLGFRVDLEAKSKQFYKDHWVLFFQPENLTPKRKEKLQNFLNMYPDLHIYRQMTVQVGSIYRLPPEEIDGHQIDDLEESPTFSEKLNTAIRTLKKHKANILRFKEFYQRHPDLPKACRTNMEYYNSRFKAPFKRGNNLLKKERLMYRLGMQFAGEIHWFLKEKAVV